MKARRRNHMEDRPTISRRNVQTQASTNQIENSEPIPLDLIFEILSRLPSKSIARCRCVSKPWASMLRRQDFTELYLTRSSTRPRLLFVCQRENNDLLFFTAPQEDENSSLISASYHMKLSVDDHSLISGSVHGFPLVSLRVSKGRNGTSLAICNPSTGESLPLPKAKTRRVDVYSFIGYDPVEKQLKVLAMTWKWITEDTIRVSEQHQVLTLGAKKMSWRMVECNIPHYHLSSGISIDGVLYYLAENDRGTVVVSFDVRSEKFGLIENVEEKAILSDSILVNYKGKLGVVTWDGYQGVNRDTTSFEMCVLEDPEKHEWSKIVYEMPSTWENLVADGDQLYFVGVTGTNEFLLSPQYPSDPFYVCYYNIESKTIRKVEIQGMEAFTNCRVHTCVNHVENVNKLQMF